MVRFYFKEENKYSTAQKKSEISALPGQTYPRIRKVKFILLVLDHLPRAHFIVQYRTNKKTILTPFKRKSSQSW